MKQYTAVRRSFSFFLVLVLLVSLCGSIYAEQSSADDIFEEGLRLMADSGNPENAAKGIALVVAAANAGSAKAMVQVGVMYSAGLGKLLSDDFKEGDEAVLALSWYEKAAAAGEPDLAAAAISSDAFSYFLGSEDGHIKEDDAVALKYFEKAAEYGDASAINMMVAFYIYGFGVEQNPEKALELCSRLADQGDEEALYSMEDYAYAYFAGTKEGIDINFATSFMFYEKLASYGNERAMYNLGLLYESGLGVSRDHEKAIEWLTKAKEAGYEPASAMLSDLNTQTK